MRHDVALLAWLALLVFALSNAHVVGDFSGDQSSQGASAGDQTLAAGNQGSADDGDQVPSVGGDASSAGEQSSAEGDTEPLYHSPEGTVPNLVLVGSPDSPQACIAVLAAPMYVLAPAYCVVQMSPSAEWWADFGFQVVTSNDIASSVEEEEGDSEVLRGVLVGRFRWEKRVAITSIMYQPGFLEAFFGSSANRSDASGDVYDWAVLQLAETVVGPIGHERMKMANVAHSDVLGKATALTGVLRVDRASLDVTWVDDNFVFENERYGLPSDETTKSKLFCTIPRRPEQRVVDDDSSKYCSVYAFVAWSLWELFLGFGSNHSDPDAFQSFTFVDASALEFVMAATNGTATYSVPRVLGGSLQTLTPELMFMTGIRGSRDGVNECGGSLVSPTFVLTAAHCVESDDVTRWVSIGSKYNEGAETGEQIKVLRVIRHPEYDRAAMKNDLALLELKYPSVQSPISLYDPLQFSVSPPREGEILGFGVTTPAGSVDSLSGVLLSATVDVIASNQVCMQTMPETIDDSMFCALGQDGADACSGDSGGHCLYKRAKVEASSCLGS